MMTLKILVDTGSSKNYIRDFDLLKGIQRVNEPFTIKTVNGETEITHKTKIELFGHVETFFILPDLTSFDAIIGYDFLKKVGAIIDVKRGYLYYGHEGHEELKFLYCKSVNSIKIDFSSIPESISKSFRSMITRLRNVFADPDSALPFNTNIVATIRTNTDQPVFSKSYPYPFGVTDFVNSEISHLLRDGIIRPSRSPYNSPIWVVDKKGQDENGEKKHRLVIDFKKLNSHTISDKYPIPDISVILSSLGEAKYFSTIDLKSGFHQIMMKEEDREKTAFSVNNGKYEFCRLPFGLKNAPSIFQRAIDDVLREDIGVRCYVYIDDVIIFSQDIGQHLKDIEIILGKLCDANMRVSPEKCEFFKQEVEFLGFLVSEGGIKTSPEKIQTILNYEEPRTLRSLRAFLGLSGYYRRFVRNYASLVKPLTKYLRGENGNVSARQSKNIQIALDNDAKASFEKVKRILASEDVLLFQPDFNQPFDLTTDASSTAIGAVLSQKGKPITFVSRTLSKAEENYATNEREMLAVLWSLQKLRNYLYACKGVNIFTDHQPLTFAMSHRNSNAKMKRWQAAIEEYAPTFHYKPGKENIVADALSRQFMHGIDDSDSSAPTQSQDSHNSCESTASQDETLSRTTAAQEETLSQMDVSESGDTVHSEESLSDFIRSSPHPVNCFKNQIVIAPGNDNFYRRKILFKKFLRHTIGFKDQEFLITKLRESINPSVNNGIHCELSVLAIFQDYLQKEFPGSKVLYCKSLVIDVTNPDDQSDIIAKEHQRAHRCYKDVSTKILQSYFFPNISKQVKAFISSCDICWRSKYQRKPIVEPIRETPIPTKVGEILHVDIFSTNQAQFLTCVDKLSKFALIEPISSRSLVDIKPALIRILSFFKKTELLVTDNERALCSETIKALLRTHFQVNHYKVPPFHSSSNGQVERFHSTLAEIARCLALEYRIADTVEIFLLACDKYNRSIHSVTGECPIDIIHSVSPDRLKQVSDRIKAAQGKVLESHNRQRMHRVFDPGKKVYVKTTRRVGNKLTSLFSPVVVLEDLGTKIKTTRGLIIHKSNIK